MTDIWNERAEAYRTSQTHASGDDLDLVVEWCEPAEGVTVLDVATGGGHVARRLREAGAEVVTVDAAPGMQPDVDRARRPSPVRRRELRRRRLPHRRAPLPRRARRASRRWPASRATAS